MYDICIYVPILCVHITSMGRMGRSRYLQTTRDKTRQDKTRQDKTRRDGTGRVRTGCDSAVPGCDPPPTSRRHRRRRSELPVRRRGRPAKWRRGGVRSHRSWFVVRLFHRRAPVSSRVTLVGSTTTGHAIPHDSPRLAVAVTVWKHQRSDQQSIPPLQQRQRRYPTTSEVTPHLPPIITKACNKKITAHKDARATIKPRPGPRKKRKEKVQDPVILKRSAHANPNL